MFICFQRWFVLCGRCFIYLCLLFCVFHVVGRMCVFFYLLVVVVYVCSPCRVCVYVYVVLFVRLFVLGVYQLWLVCVFIVLCSSLCRHLVSRVCCVLLFDAHLLKHVFVVCVCVA